MAEIALEKLTKVYPDGTEAVRELDLAIEDGEFVVLVGPSGCGKTTALRMVAGLEEITSGVVRIGDRVVNDLPPKDRDIAMVFQSYALYPHMDVEGNIAFGLRMRGLPKGVIAERVQKAARLLGLSEVLHKKPRTLSGGQRQRVAMGRSIVREPQAFLMDEPLSNLDAKLRVQMRAEISRIQHELEVTTIYVTHDQTEAMTVGDRVGVMNKGVLQQVDRPQVLYDLPVNLFVAEFIGSPAMNLLEGELGRANGGFAVDFGPGRLAVTEVAFEARPALRGYDGRKVILGIRPEDIEDAALAPDTREDARLRATIEIRQDMGSEVFLHFGLGIPAVRTRKVVEASGREAIEALSGHDATFIARVDRATRVREGQQAELAVNAARLHFFDPETESGIYGE